MYSSSEVRVLCQQLNSTFQSLQLHVIASSNLVALNQLYVEYLVKS